jgi:hypothetical protein
LPQLPPTKTIWTPKISNSTATTLTTIPICYIRLT